jgi:hypothetical protein
MALVDGKQLKPGSVPTSALQQAVTNYIVTGQPDEFGNILAPDGITTLSADDLTLQGTKGL